MNIEELNDSGMENNKQASSESENISKIELQYKISVEHNKIVILPGVSLHQPNEYVDELNATTSNVNEMSTDCYIQQSFENGVLDLSTNSSNNSISSLDKNTNLFNAHEIGNVEQKTIDVIKSDDTSSNPSSNLSQEIPTTGQIMLIEDSKVNSLNQGSNSVVFQVLTEGNSSEQNDTCKEQDKSSESSDCLAEAQHLHENFTMPTKFIDETESKESEPSPSENNTQNKLFGEDKGPHWYKVVNNVVTPPVIVSNLPKIFADFPIFGKPKNRDDTEDFKDRMVRQFIGCDLDDAEYNELKEYCSIDNLRTGKELIMSTKIPTVKPMEPLNELNILEDDSENVKDPDLNVLRKLMHRMKHDVRNKYAKKLKYRGCRLLPLSYEHEQNNMDKVGTEPPDMEPGKDILYKIRVYRPFIASKVSNDAKGYMYTARTRGRHSVFSCEVVAAGAAPLAALRRRLACRNDDDMRLDVAARPHARALTAAKEIFPSGFLFINNVFYVDRRAGCHDTSAPTRAWARARGLGDFPVRDMATPLHRVPVRLAHPEVYVHQGNCEHVFVFSEIRLLSYNDPLYLSCYPCYTSISQNQTINCTTCAEYSAKWIVTGCDKVPFDPAFFCEGCYLQYLYINNKKIGDFKAYSYNGNEFSMLKQQPTKDEDVM